MEAANSYLAYSNVFTDLYIQTFHGSRLPGVLLSITRIICNPKTLNHKFIMFIVRKTLRDKFY